MNPKHPGLRSPVAAVHPRAIESTPPGQPTNDPLFLPGSVENRRMVLQARVWEPATRRALQQVGLAAGQSVLDAGCGAGEVMRMMAAQVGPRGRVTGLDIDTPRALQGLAGLRGPNPFAEVVRFVPGDVTSLATIADAPYDLVFARRLLFHLADPVAVLRRLWHWVRPGGTLLVMDHDSTPMAPLAPHAVFERATRLIGEAFHALGRDMQIGAHMPAHFEQAGIGPADGCEVSGAIQPAGPSAALLRSVLAELRPTLTRLGLASEKEAHRLDGDLAAAATDPVLGRWPDLIATWKRKPITGGTPAP